MSRRERAWKRVDRFRDRWIWLIWLLLALGLAVKGNTWLLLFAGIFAGIRFEQRFLTPLPHPVAARQVELVDRGVKHFDRRERRWRKERIERGFSERDAWDFFAFLGPVIAEGCRELIRMGAGHPSKLGEGDEGYRKWHQILDEIATGFEAGQRASEEIEPRPPELDRAFDLLAEWWEHLWD